MERLIVNDLCCSYGNKTAAENISLHVGECEFVGLIGPNGSGKSTVLKSIYRAIKPDSGTITLDSEDLLKMSYRRSALKLAVVGQENEVPFDLTVEEMVAMGRAPHKRLFDTDNAYDKYMVHHALEHLGMEDMAKRGYTELSGGEKQRVLLARAIAQESSFFILDEPTNHLDIYYQMQIFDFIRRLKVTVLSAVHDLNMAALYCDRLYVMKHGRIVLEGTPEEVLEPQNIFDIFGVRSRTKKDPDTGKISVTFLPGGTRPLRENKEI